MPEPLAARIVGFGLLLGLPSLATLTITSPCTLELNAPALDGL